jgi:hypothetical protein
MLHRKFLLVCLLCCYSATALADRQKVGIAVATKINTTDEQVALLLEAMATALSETLDVEVQYGPEADAKMPAETRSDACLGNTECLVKAGQALGVERLLALVVVGISGQVKVEITWVDIANQSTALRPPVDSALEKQALIEAFSKDASALLPDAPPKTPPQPAEPPAVEDAPTDGAGTLLGAPKAVPEPRGRHLDGWSKTLVYGGSALLAGAMVSYVVFGVSKCENFTRRCERPFGNWSEEGYYWGKLTDVSAGLGATVLLVGVFRYYTSADSPEGPVTLTVGQERVALTFGGTF